MKRGEITTVADLRSGDRFYKHGGAKTVMQFIEEESHDRFRVCEAKATINGLSNKKLDKILKGGTQVVFLRNVNDPS